LKKFTFGKNRRLVANRQFKAVLDHSISVSNGLLVLYMAENNLDYSRLGISVGKAFGGAVARNRAKRLLREAWRLYQGQIPAGFDYLLMISTQGSRKINGSADSKRAVRRITFEQVVTSFLTLANTLQKKQRKART